jgi:hypothetical protein
MKNKLTRSQITFKVDGVPHELDIVHNLPNQFGLSIENALDNWLARTKDYTEEAFIKYINDKNTAFICVSFKELSSCKV